MVRVTTPTSADATDDPGPPPTPATSRKKQVIATIVTLVVLVIVFAGILPKFGNYADAWEQIKNMGVEQLASLAGPERLVVSRGLVPEGPIGDVRLRDERRRRRERALLDVVVLDGRLGHGPLRVAGSAHALASMSRAGPLRRR